MYSVADYCRMVGDRVRMEAYERALQRAIRPGCTVLDIGTGTGFFALLACRLGARRVYAIEPDDAIQVARELAAVNGCADRIEFIQDLSTRSLLAEPADVIVSDMRGALPLYDQHIPSIVDARTRLLAGDGTLIPQRDTLWVALVEAADHYRLRTGLWPDNPYELDLRAIRQIATQSLSRARVRPEQLLVEAQCWATLDYRTIESPHARGEVCWTIDREGTTHGLVVWFDAVLSDGIGYSNSPAAPELVYGSTFFPFSEPILLTRGDQITVAMQANLIDGQYVWNWKTRVTEPKSVDGPKASFQQSTFFGMPLSRSSLRKRAADYLPALSEEGQLHAFALSLMATGDRISVGEIASELCRQFPRHFLEWNEALTWAGDLAVKYSRD